MAASDTGYLVYFPVAWQSKLVNLHVAETEWEVKNFHKNFHDILERGWGGGGGRGRNKMSYDILLWTNLITSGSLIKEINTLISNGIPNIHIKINIATKKNWSSFWV